MRKRLGIFVVVLSVLSGVISGASALDVPDEQFTIGTSPTAGPNNSKQVGVLFEESVDTLRMPTILYSYKERVGTPPTALSFCTGVDDPACSSADNLKFYSLFAPCVSATDVDCIEGLFALPTGSPTRINGVFQEFMPATVARPFKAAPGLPQAANSGVWKIPGVTNKGGTDDYVVILSRVGSLKKVNGTFVAQPAGSDPWGGGDFRAAIYPVKKISDSRFKANVASIHKQPNGDGFVGIDHPSQTNWEACAIVADGACAMRQGFPDGVQFGMSVRFSKVVNGWMHGRINTPEIDYQVKDYGSRLEMKGFATKVPIVAGWVDKPSSFPNGIPEVSLGSSTYPGASNLEALNFWSKLLGDKAVANPSQWIFYNLSDREMQQANTCIYNSKTLAGMVSTNSTTYLSGPPVYDKANGTLDYKVASAHFLPDGSVFKGEYDLYIDSKVARCIYGFTNAPISATISIVSESGVNTVATSTMTENAGWIHLSAKGFTFSNPTLKVKLTQDGSAKPAPTPTPPPTKSAEPSPEPTRTPSFTPTPQVTQTPAKPVVRVFLCKKGNKIVRNKAASVKCPKGWTLNRVIV